MVRFGRGAVEITEDGGRMKRLPARFYRSSNGGEPVREWLLSLGDQDRRRIDDDIRAVEFGWPVGLPLCRPITSRRGLWEIRSSLTDGQIARIFFCIFGGSLWLLHGIIKKTQKTPDAALDLAVRRQREVER
jgi:phage-related protein